MKKLIFLFSILLTSVLVQAQIGIGTNYVQHSSAENWTSNFDFFNSQDKQIVLPGSGFEGYVDYRLKLKNIRIEFYPSVGYGEQNQDIVLNTESLTAKTTGLHLSLNSRIYPMDLEGDCDCPTWRKEGPTLEKGLFLQVGAGFSFYNFELANQSELVTNSKDTGFHFGAGIGFDIGINDLLTITPMGMLRYYPSLNWEGLEDESAFIFPEEIKAESDLLQIQFGIHLGFHLRN